MALMFYAKPGERPACFTEGSQRDMRPEVFIHDAMTCWITGEGIPAGTVCLAYREGDKEFVCSVAGYQSLVDGWLAVRGER